MAAHTKKQFDLFMSQLRETNATLDFYCDFPKIARNVADIEISLNTLNYLIGKENLREAVEALWRRDPNVFAERTIRNTLTMMAQCTRFIRCSILWMV